MSTIDWVILVVPLLLLIMVAGYVRRYMRGVSDFLAAGRSAGRYLVSVADGMAAMGLITAIGAFEMFYQAGTAVHWWSQLAAPVGLLIALFGFVIYRFRETRAMTMAQFFEVRYSRRLRIFMGALAFIAGVVNYGIFPIVGARFFIHFCGLPTSVDVAGFAVPMLAILMAVFLSIGLYFVLNGGQLQVMVTDFLQGLVCGVLFLVVAFAVLYVFSMNQMFEAATQREPGKSILNPFDTHKISDFNIWYVLISIFSSVYTYMSWQGNSGYNASALNAHEAKMGKIIGGWRTFSQGLMFTLLGLAAITFMHHPDFAGSAATAQAKLAAIGTAEGQQIATQMTVPVAIGEFLPWGIKGCFALIMLFLMVSTDATYLHSWGSIFVQDVILPFRKTPLRPRQHLLLLRLAIIGVAIFAFTFGLVFPQTDYVFMFFNITGAIFLGGSGAVIIGGLYWRRATTAGAWSAMIVGSGLAVAGILVPMLVPGWPLNGTTMMFISMLAAIAVFIVVSLSTCSQPFNMQRMLHRGPYSVREDETQRPLEDKPLANWKRLLLGIDENFSRGDRFLSGALFTWTMTLFAAFIIVTAINLVSPWSDRAWWRWVVVNNIYLPIGIGLLTTVWFTIGGIGDLRRLFHKLRTQPRDVLDDGMVVDHQNLEDVRTVSPEPTTAISIEPSSDPDGTPPLIVLPKL
ncbi:MAG TPA: hypothetical protein VGN72_12790 [Tepidisphaeraceae bacterium]|jgi:SSS family solute:Na+ symporter|nr:hypothetical protein [Tepidisphaeraceae bacterium]